MVEGINLFDWLLRLNYCNPLLSSDYDVAVKLSYGSVVR